MKLIDDFFKVLDMRSTENGFSSVIRMDPNHVVYTGHFPGFPVTPGVVQLQIVHELLEWYLGKKLTLKTMPQCKFLKIVNPKETEQLVVDVVFEEQDGLVRVSAKGGDNGVVFFRFESTYELTQTNNSPSQ